MEPRGASDEERLVLVGQDAAPGVERVVDRVFVEVGQPRRVDVGETEESAREVRGVVVGAKDTAELGVEHGLCLLPAGKRGSVEYL